MVAAIHKYILETFVSDTKMHINIYMHKAKDARWFQRQCEPMSSDYRVSNSKFNIIKIITVNGNRKWLCLEQDVGLGNGM